MYPKSLIDSHFKIKICLLILSLLFISTKFTAVSTVADSFDIQFNQTINSEQNRFSVILMIGDGMGFEHVKSGR
ncbi:MAG: hypothetical protein ACXABI_01325 [Candidatus Hodarchaeales archaeon]